MSGRFYVTIWDPTLIISQIVAVQSVLYFSFGALLIFTSFFTGTECMLRTLFSPKALNFGDSQGVLAVACYMLSAPCGSFALWKIVKRAKLCLDFSVTAYVIHLMICWMYSSAIPQNVSWWILTVVAVTVMCVTGEFLCLKTELEDIPLLGVKVDL